MNWWQYLILFALYIALVSSAVIPEDDDTNAQGLYSKSEHVNILTGRNFERKIYGQRYAQLVQFYNSFCGHCRAFAPKFKAVASETWAWRKVIQLSVIDCFEEANNEVCRDFEVMAYPTLRYIHEYYTKGNGNIGDRMHPTDTSDKLKTQLLAKMLAEQESNRLKMAPSLAVNYFNTYTDALQNVPQTTQYTFLIFENENSTVGAELALELNNYQNVVVERVHESSRLRQNANIVNIPTIIALSSQKDPVNITPQVHTTLHNLLNDVKMYLRSQNYKVPDLNPDSIEPDNVDTDNAVPSINSEVVYYSDLEKTLKTTLHTEITRYKKLNNEQRDALLEYLEVIRDNFPFKGNDNLKTYMSDLIVNVRSSSEWSGSDLYALVNNLQARHNPYRSPDTDYKACKGSQPQYRGYTCGLWTMFHSLTVGAALKTGAAQEGPKVLKAMHGYVKNFFGCTHCSEHFQAMAARNRLFDVKDNDKAVLWLWISHNEVNLRLAGDVTEDPEHPKIQFPSQAQCPECRLARGAWNLPVVYQYLLSVYGEDNIQDEAHQASGTRRMFSQLDLGMLSFLYILSFIILILVIRFYLTKRFYRKRFYKHGRGKV